MEIQSGVARVESCSGLPPRGSWWPRRRWPRRRPSQPVTFTKDIAPILQRSCQQCHRPDSIAPMSLLTYEEARPYARAMKQRTALRDTRRGVMPPWFIEKNIGIQKFKDDISLSDEEIATIAQVGRQRRARGNPADLPHGARVRRHGRVDPRHAGPDRVVAQSVRQRRRADWWGPSAKRRQA